MLWLILLLGTDVTVERVDLPLGGHHRVGEWNVAHIHLRVERAFDGELEIESGSPVRCTRRIQRTSGGVMEEVLPFLPGSSPAPSVVLRENGAEILRLPLCRSWIRVGEEDFLVGVVPGTADAPSEIPAIHRLADGRMARLFPLAVASSVPSWLYEPVDVVIGGRDPGGAWRMLGGEHWSDGAAWQTRLETLSSRRASRIPLIDGRIWDLAPRNAWPAPYRSFVALSALGFGAISFVLLWFLGRRTGRRLLVFSLCGLVIVSLPLLSSIFPRGGISLSIFEVEHRDVRGSGARLGMFFATAHRDGPSSISFPTPVRPVFRNPEEAARSPLRLEFGLCGACRIEGAWRERGESVALLSLFDREAPEVTVRVLERDPVRKVGIRSSRPLSHVSVLLDGWNGGVGEIRAGEEQVVEIPQDGPAPSDPYFAFLRSRFLFGGNFVAARCDTRTLDPNLFQGDVLDARLDSSALLLRFP